MKLTVWLSAFCFHIRGPTSNPSYSPIAAFAGVPETCKGLEWVQILRFFTHSNFKGGFKCFKPLGGFKHFELKQANCIRYFCTVTLCNLITWQNISSMRSFTGHSWAGFFAWDFSHLRPEVENYSSGQYPWTLIWKKKYKMQPDSPKRACLSLQIKQKARKILSLCA